MVHVAYFTTFFDVFLAFKKKNSYFCNRIHLLGLCFSKTLSRQGVGARGNMGFCF